MAAPKELVHFIQVLPEPSFLISGAGEVVGANDAAAELIGTRVSDLSNKRLVALLTDPQEKVEHYIGLCARSRQLLPGSLTWSTITGQPIEIRCDAAVIQPRTETEAALIFLRCRPKAEATDHFHLLTDKIGALTKEILERKKAEQQRDALLTSERNARLEAEHNSHMKDEFLATLSHELRTPLFAILGWTQLLEKNQDELPINTRQGLQVIDRNAKLQRQLIEDLLDMSRITSGKMRLDVQRVYLPTVIENAIESIRPAADAKGIRIQVALDPITGSVKGDPSRLQQIVWNLLSNAVKFTPKGGRVQVFLERVNSHIEITISDTGDGIKPEFLPHVFDRFRQGDGTSKRKYGGLGLGLSIVKQLAELHGGSVRAKSPGEGQGATFVIALPVLVLHEDEAEQKTRVHPRSHTGPEGPCGDAPNLKGVKALVVDDEADTRELVKQFLHHCDVEVMTAASGADALKILKHFKPHVVVSDIGMPSKDGYEFIKDVRKLPESDGGKTPAIALTAFARSEDRARAMLSGYQLHLAKPIESAELIAAVANLAGRTGV